MARVKYGAARHRKKVRVLRAARGFRGPRSKQWRLVQETLRRSRVFAYRDRRRRKRTFRALWITRLTAACRERGINYSRFIFGLAQADIELNRKVLSEMAIQAPADFDAIVAIAKQHPVKNAEAA